MDNDSIRLLVFFVVLVVMASVEALWPRRDRTMTRLSRWTTNISLTFINSLALKLLGPVAAITAANYALDNSYGLLAWSPVPLPFWLEVLIGFLLLDLMIYCQHVMSHKLPFLWRFHKVHHADRDIDVTTGFRFHPIEAVLSMCYKVGVIFLLGPLPVAVFLFEVMLSGAAMFNHANVRLPLWLDRALRLVVITPDVHRVHHSTTPKETDSNYGFFLSVWDRLFKTFIPQPALGHTDMNIGLNEYQTDKPASLIWCASVPFTTSQSKKVLKEGSDD